MPRRKTLLTMICQVPSEFKRESASPPRSPAQDVDPVLRIDGNLLDEQIRMGRGHYMRDGAILRDRINERAWNGTLRGTFKQPRLVLLSTAIWPGDRFAVFALPEGAAVPHVPVPAKC